MRSKGDRHIRVAVQISGQPRVCELVQKFAGQLEGADTVDWFIVFWQHNPRPDSLGWRWWDLVPESWRELPNRDRVLALFKSNLPSHHRVVSYSAEPNPIIKLPQGIVPEHCDLHSVYAMWRGWSLVTELRQQWEAEHGSYDLIIKGRPDAAFNSSLDLNTVDPSVITICDGPMDPGCIQWDHQRSVQYYFSDVLFMGGSAAMNTAMQIEHKAAGLCQRKPLHPDLTLARWLKSQAVPVCRAKWTTEFRLQQPDFSAWCK